VTVSIRSVRAAQVLTMSSDPHLEVQVEDGDTRVLSKRRDSVVEVASGQESVEESQTHGRVAERVDLLVYARTDDAL
jgi:hypothetical protein